jgi:hypothetical protein
MLTMGMSMELLKINIYWVAMESPYFKWAKESFEASWKRQSFGGISDRVSVPSELVEVHKLNK